VRPSPSAARRVLAAAVDAAADATVLPGFSRLGIALRRRLEDWRDPPSMKGQVAVVTGATSGIGLAAAVAMARLGASVHLVGRDVARAAAARAAVEEAGSAPAELDLVDLSDADAVVTLGLRLSERYEKLNVLVHNAGALTRTFKTTPAGVELTVATQVIAPYLLTATLAPLLWSSSPATIVTVSSGGMYTQGFDLARLEMTAADYDGAVAYARCKRAQVVLASAWAKRYGAAGVSSYSMHPGWADTPGLKAGLPRFEAFLRPLLRTPAQGADTAVWLAAGGAACQARGLGSAPPVSGFFQDRHLRHEHRFPVGGAEQPGEAGSLLEWCATRTGVVTPLPSQGRD